VTPASEKPIVQIAEAVEAAVRSGRALSEVAPGLTPSQLLRARQMLVDPYWRGVYAKERGK
jgi:hypothetical protein